MPDINEAIGLKTANSGPSREYVAIMESNPVVGVDTKNDKILDLCAPSLLKEDAIGITPQEHTGRGIPNSVLFIIDMTPGFPICREMAF